MSDKHPLLSVNVNGHTEKKNGLTYLTWAWAWAEVLKYDPDATWEVVEYHQPDGTTAPCMYVGGGTAMVRTRVTIKGKARDCVLPVMDHRNKAIKDPDAFAINTAVMRCMTKAISMHGLGLYIYAGEDLPEGEEPEGDKKPENVIPGSFRSSPLTNEDGKSAIDLLPPEEADYMRTLGHEVTELVKTGAADEAVRRLSSENLDTEQKMALWCVLDSKTRAAIKKAQQPQKEAA